jgi:hypothetical protein
MLRAILSVVEEDRVTGFPVVPGYEIESELGRGGMAVVYSAIENDLGRQVAIKVVNADASEPGHIQRLENEARGLAALHHPHIVDLYRFGRTADGSLFYVMPLLSGGSLADVPKPMPEDKVVALLDELLDALAHAHGADIIHRDIKPANILFDRHGRPLLADFGAAFMRKRDTRMTAHGEAIGSSGYMSPEQARGQAVDARSDLYSVAVLAFELLTGALPWDREDALSTALAQIEQPVPRLPDALRHWQAFFYRALAVNSEHRFASAAAMRAAIHSLRKPPMRSLAWTGMTAGVVVGVLVLGGLAFAAWRARAPAPVEPAPANVSSPAAPVAVATTASAPAPASASTAPAAAAPIAAPSTTPARVGDRLSDAEGPPLVLVKPSKGGHPGLAVMTAPVDTSLYASWARHRERKPVKCPAGPAPAQGCLDLDAANDVARWLSKVTGEKYRVPSRAELEASIARVAHVPAYAWTGSCNEVRVAVSRNAAQRGWSRLRRWVGKPRPAQYEVRCDGHYALKLDGHGSVARAQQSATPESVVVLVRDVPAGK